MYNTFATRNFSFVSFLSSKQLTPAYTSMQFVPLHRLTGLECINDSILELDARKTGMLEGGGRAGGRTPPPDFGPALTARPPQIFGPMYNSPLQILRPCNMPDVRS